MFNLDDITNEHHKKHNLIWPYIPDHRYRTLIIGDSGSGKPNALLSLIKEQDSDNKNVKVSNEPKYEFLIKKRKGAGIKHLNDPKAFIEYSAYMNDVYNNISDYNPTRKRKILIVFDDMIADITANKKFQAKLKNYLLDAGN